MDIPEIKIYGPIGGDEDDSVTVNRVSKELEAIGDVPKIRVRINSEGGSVRQGIGIAKLLKNHPAEIETVVEGGAFSIAGYIACIGDKRTIDADSMLHIHGPRAESYVGTIEEHEDDLEQLWIAKASMLKVYSQATGRPEEEIEKVLTRDRFFSAEEALSAGYMTAIGEPSNVVAILDENKFPIPSKFKAMLAKQRESKSLEKTKMSTNPKPATPKELRAKFPKASDGFILAQSLADATIEDATAAYIDELEAENKELSARQAKANVEDSEIDEASAMDDEEELSTMDKMVEAVVAKVMDKIESKAEKTKSMEHDDEDEAEAMDDDEAEAMEDEESTANVEDSEIDEASAEKIVALLGKRFGLVEKSKPAKQKAKAKRSSASGKKAFRMNRLGTNAVRKPKTTAGGAAAATAKAEVRQLAEARAKDNGVALNVATRQILKENPKLKSKMIAEAN